MNNYLLIYLITRLDAIRGLLSLCFIIPAAVLFALFTVLGFHLSEGYSVPKIVKNSIIACITISILSITIHTFIPKTQEAMLIIAGGKTIEYIEHDKNLKKIPGQSTEIVSLFLQKELNKLKKETVSQ